MLLANVALKCYKSGHTSGDHVLSLEFARSGAISSAMLLVGNLSRMLSPINNTDRNYTMNLWQLGFAAITGIAFLSHPRRPNVSIDGQEMDRYISASLLEQYTFSWSKNLLEIQLHRDIQLEDVPLLEPTNRAADLVLSAPAYDCNSKLWLWLVRIHASALYQQWVLAIMQSIIALAPEYATQKFLHRLERGEMRMDAQSMLCLLAICCCLVARLWLGIYSQWTTRNRLEAPCESVLTSLIFRKSVQIENIQQDAGNTSGSDGSTPETRKAVINHLRLDT